jgi:hypothetical protein
MKEKFKASVWATNYDGKIVLMFSRAEDMKKIGKKLDDDTEVSVTLEW